MPFPAKTLLSPGAGVCHLPSGNVGKGKELVAKSKRELHPKARPSKTIDSIGARQQLKGSGAAENLLICTATTEPLSLSWPPGAWQIVKTRVKSTLELELEPELEPELDRSGTRVERGAESRGLQSRAVSVDFVTCSTAVDFESLFVGIFCTLLRAAATSSPT